MNNQERMQEIKQRLTAALQPSSLEVIDESHLHVGHAGAQSGAGHFAVTIGAKALDNLSKVKAHQLIYKAVDGLIPTEIHALRITILAGVKRAF
jgi:BolA protein